MPLTLSADKAHIFRIAHRANVPWILRNGLHCRNSQQVDPKFQAIGHPELIEKRSRWRVPVGCCGTLSDYVSF